MWFVSLAGLGVEHRGVTDRSPRLALRKIVSQHTAWSGAKKHPSSAITQYVRPYRSSTTQRAPARALARSAGQRVSRPAASLAAVRRGVLRCPTQMCTSEFEASPPADISESAALRRCAPARAADVVGKLRRSRWRAPTRDACPALTTVSTTPPARSANVRGGGRGARSTHGNPAARLNISRSPDGHPAPEASRSAAAFQTTETVPAEVKRAPLPQSAFP